MKRKKKSSSRRTFAFITNLGNFEGRLHSFGISLSQFCLDGILFVVFAFHLFGRRRRLNTAEHRRHPLSHGSRVRTKVTHQIHSIRVIAWYSIYGT